MKKAQGLPITTIIIAALGIIVLVIMAAIFSGQIGKFGRAASECPGRCIVESRPTGVPSTSRHEIGRECNSEFETSLSGTYIPKNTPKDAKLNDWKCDSCCIPTG